jgi:Fur family transcriptional regulator, ferric uptake regulator
MTKTNLERQVESRLIEHDVRFTGGRRKLTLALASCDGPRSAADLYREAGADIPLSSIYRSLAIFEDAGVVAPHFSTKGTTRYELAEWLTGHHHHLVCTTCGDVEDVEFSPETELQLEAIVDRIGAEVSFTPKNHALEIEGRCSRCR